MYRKVSEHRGWPVLRNVVGKYCYRHEPTDRWFFNSELTPDIDSCNSYIEDTEGPLPAGAQTWCSPNTPQKIRDAILTVTVLVRASLVNAVLSMLILLRALSHASTDLCLGLSSHATFVVSTGFVDI